MDYTDYMNKALEVAEEFKNGSLYKDFIKLKKELLKKYQKELNEFNIIKEKLNDLNKYDLDYSKTLDEYFKWKSFFLESDLYLKYQEKENEINKNLALINKRIATAVSKNVKFLNELGLIEGEK